MFLVHRNQKVDYRLLVAAAYLGLGCTWHAGLSASAPLLVNTPDNFLIQGEILQTTIPATETIFSLFKRHLTCVSHPCGDGNDGGDAPFGGKQLPDQT